jgi:hypothetical protein
MEPPLRKMEIINMQCNPSLVAEIPGETRGNCNIVSYGGLEK